MGTFCLLLHPQCIAQYLVYSRCSKIYGKRNTSRIMEKGLPKFNSIKAMRNLAKESSKLTFSDV